MQENTTNENPCVIIITTVCGGGHLQAAGAFKAQISRSSPQFSIKQIDIFNDWLGKIVGGFLTKRWNAPLRKGHNFLSLSYSYFGIPFIDPVFFLFIFVRAFITFIKLPIVRVIDTQPVGTAAISLALLATNKINKRRVRLEKILTEIPTKKSIHFFHPLKLLPKFLKKTIDLCVVDPSPKEDTFWPKYTGLSSQQIKKIAPPLREAFFSLPTLAQNEKVFSISFSSNEEKETSLKIARIEGLIQHKGELEIQLDCSSNCYVVTIMLGSQPPTKMIQKYLEKYYQLAKENPHFRDMVIFVLGNSTISSFEVIKNFWLNQKNLPSNFHPVLLSTQEQITVAGLLSASDLTITRAGGLTSMELLAIKPKNSSIHTDVIHKGKPVLGKMPPWEIGNAEVLIDKIGAKIIHPDFIQLSE